MSDWRASSFRNSLEAVARLAVEETGALGYAFFRKQPHHGSFLLLARSGEAPDAVPCNVGPSRPLVVYPLPGGDIVEGCLVFAFRSDSEAVQMRTRLDEVAAAIRAIWDSAAKLRYTDLVEKVEALEARLMDSKINDRVRGMAQDGGNNKAETVVRHVEGVLRPTQTRHLLENVVSALEDEIEERALAKRAKEILQDLYGISEEEAHARLRLASRKTRMRVKDVAQRVIEKRNLPSQGQI